MVNKIVLIISILISLLTFNGCKRDGIFDIKTSPLIFVDNNFIGRVFNNIRVDEKIYVIQCANLNMPISFNYNYDDDSFLLIINNDEIKVFNGQIVVINQSGFIIFNDYKSAIMDGLKSSEDVSLFLSGLLKCQGRSLYKDN